jgi:signal transduction histidine kinase
MTIEAATAVAAPEPEGPVPLPDTVPALRMEVRGRTITEATAAVARLMGVAADELVGRAFVDLVCSAERQAVGRRLDDVMLLGRDAFGAIALCPRGEPTAWVEIDAHYVYKHGQRVEMVVRRLDRPAPVLELVPEPTAAPEPAAPGPDSITEPAGLERAAPVLEAPRPDDNRGQVAGLTEPAVSADARLSLVTEPEASVDARLALVADPEASADARPVPVTEPPALAVPDLLLAAAEPDLGAANAHAHALGLSGATTALAMGALESAGVAALAVASDGTVDSATSATEKRLGLPIARVRGTHLADLFDLPEAAGRALAHARREGLRQSVLGKLSGSQEQVFLDWVPGPGTGSGLVLVGTGEAARDQAPREADRTQAKLLSFVAHDVRGAVVNVTMGIRLVLSELAGHPALVSAERALKESVAAQTIIDDLLLVTRPGGRRRVPLSVNAIVTDVVEGRMAAAADRGLGLIWNPGPNLEVPAELSSLARAVGNLIDNALQCTNPPGTVIVASALNERTRPGVTITVADTGPGIPDDIRPIVFEPFITGRDGGTGLGLAIVQRVVLDHGGQVDFVTSSETGTTFTIWLPAE